MKQMYIIGGQREIMRYYNFDTLKDEEIKVEGHPEWFKLTNFTMENIDDTEDSEERPVLIVFYTRMESEVYGIIDSITLKKQVLLSFKEIALRHGYSPEAVKSIRLLPSDYDDSFSFSVSDTFVTESDPFYRFAMKKIDDEQIPS